MWTVSCGQISPVKPGNRWSVVEREAFMAKILHAALLPGQR